MGAILLVGGTSTNRELDERFVRMVRCSPYRGRVAEAAIDGVRIAVQSLGWDASLAVTPSHIVAVHGYITNLSRVAAARSLNSGKLRSQAELLASLAADLDRLPVSELRGEFALVCLERQDRRLVLARDAMGMRPLYFSIESGFTILATEVRQVVAGLKRTPPLNEQRIVEYLLRCAPASGTTILESIQAVRPARVYQVPLAAPDRTASSKYWDPPPEDGALGDSRELAEELRRLLFQAVERSMPSTSFGVALSGGLDSTSVLSILNEFEKDLPNEPERVRCYSLVYPGMECDESGLIRLLLKKLNREGTFIDASEISATDVVPIVVDRMDDCFVPFTYQLVPLCEAIAGDELGIMLTGVGGDEWLFGHWSSILDEAWRGHVLRAARDFFAVEKEVVSRRTMARRLLAAASSRWRRPPLPPWLHRSRAIVARAMLKRSSPRFPFARNQLLRTLEIVQAGTHFLPQEQLIASFGIEVRSPLMDLDLVDFSFKLPGRCLTRGVQHKRLLRDAIGSLLPIEIAGRSCVRPLESLNLERPPSINDEISEWHLVRRRILEPGIDENRLRRVTSSNIDNPSVTVAEMLVRKYS